ncbi:hypothetical protein DL546_005494 [Coniochaeta pulveracea]|uniref:CorA-like transporter domain-containing protein n=1 Tax=Coniochaeta pulveracea TaxID=177199 RepID=A0A420YI67_9PEZI|nr:hypothetical protein DL546_005494 [Coniochaeta pulveracea]
MPASQPLPPTLQTSWLGAETYPKNLMHRTIQTYQAPLGRVVERLDEVSPRLFKGDNELLDVPFRDLETGDGKEVSKKNVGSSLDVARWLKIETYRDRNYGTSQVVVSTSLRDPKCRLIYIFAENSRGRLKISRQVLLQILTFHQVMPAYLDFIQVFGQQDEQPDLRFSSFRHQTTIGLSLHHLAVPQLGRSGRQFQMCYNLKNVELKRRDEVNMLLNEWSIRQVAIHHQFDVVEGTTLWILTKGGLDLHGRFKELIGKTARPEDKSFGTVEECFRSSLSAHLLWCYWSMDDWNAYLKWIGAAVSEESDLAVLAPTREGSAHKHYRPDDVQSLQRWQERANQATMVLNSNIDIMQSLAAYYTRLTEDKDFELRSRCSDDIQAFLAQIGDIVQNLRTQLGRASDIVKITQDRKELIIQHLQSQSADRMERLNRNMENEAVIVRIMTYIALIYLPATFVSTFFSTDVVKYQNQPGDEGSFSRLALERWLEVTLPLTLVTVAFAWLWKRLAEKKRDVEGRLIGFSIVRSSHISQPSTTQTRIGSTQLPAQNQQMYVSRQNTSQTLLPMHAHKLF